MLETIFKKLGLRREHTLVYLNLLENGLLPAGKLAKLLNIPRTTLYSLLSELTKAGLVLQNEKSSIKLWQAVDPEQIQLLINEQINDLELTRDKLGSLLINLKKSQKIDYISPKFHYFEGTEEMKKMLKDVLLYNNITTQLCWPVQDIIKVLGSDFLHKFNKKRIYNHIAIQVIWPTNKVGSIEKNTFLAPGLEVMREVRIAPEKMNFSMGYWLYKNKAMFMSSQMENFGFIVESEEMTQLMKSQFDIIWNLSKPIKDNKESRQEFLRELKKL